MDLLGLFFIGVPVSVVVLYVIIRNLDSNYHSTGRVRNFVVYRDKKGNPFKVNLADGDPGGEHE